MDQFDAARVGDSQQLRRVLTTHNVDDKFVGRTALHYATTNGHVECAKICVEMGANVNASDNNGCAPLHFASACGHIELVSLLLDAGAFVDFTDVCELTPLHHAFRNNYIDTARLLIDRGGKVENVKLLNYCLPAIPRWVKKYVTSRSKCRYIATIIIGIHKYHRTNITGNNDINVLRLISKHVWSTRMGDVWIAPPIEAKKLRRNPKRGKKV
jgi:ankyrin repeat protein